MKDNDVKPKDHEIIGILFGIATLSIFFYNIIPEDNFLIKNVIIMFIICSLIIGFAWSILQVMFNDSPFFTNLRHIISVLIFITPLLLSIFSIFNFYNLFYFLISYINVSKIIVTLYAIVFTFFFIIDYVYKRIILPRSREKKLETQK